MQNNNPTGEVKILQKKTLPKSEIPVPDAKKKN